MDLGDAFKYGPDYLTRTRETTNNQFWLNVVDRMYLLQTSNCYRSREVILTTPLWYSNIFNMQINRQWHDKGIMVVGYVLNDIHNIQTLEEINEFYNINMKFREYHGLKIKINAYLELQYKSDFIEPYPRNSSMNVLLNIDSKGVSNLYKKLHCSNENLLFELCDKWEEKTMFPGLSFSTIDLLMTHLKYIHFRTIHRKCFTKKLLSKIGLTDSPPCTFYKIYPGSIEHMLFLCPVI